MSPAVDGKRSGRTSKRQSDAALQNTLKRLRVRGIPPEDLTLANLRTGLRKDPSKWAPAASQLIRAASASCLVAIAADDALVMGLAAHLLKAVTPGVKKALPKTWAEGVSALAQLLNSDCPLAVEPDTILPIYIRCLEQKVAAVLELTSYITKHQTLTEAVFQHPSLLLDLLDRLEASDWQGTDDHGAILVTGVIGIIVASCPDQVAAHAPFMAKLHQLLAASHAGAAHLLGALSHVDSGRQLITSRPELLVALASALQGPNASWPKTLLWLIGLVRLASSPDSSAVVLGDPACCHALAEGMATALRCAQQLGPKTAVEVWGWVQKLVCHPPSRQVLLAWQLQAQGQGGEQGAAAGVAAAGAGAGAGVPAAAPPPAAAAAAVGGGPGGGGGAAEAGQPPAAAGGGSSFLTVLADALQRIPSGAEALAGEAVGALLRSAEDLEPLLEAMEAPRWLNTLRLVALGRDAQPPWEEVLVLLLAHPAGRAALWASPRLVHGALQVAVQYKHDLDPNATRWLWVRDTVREDGGYQAALLEGLRSDNTDWVHLFMSEVDEGVDPTWGSRGRLASSQYSVLRLPGLPEALAEGCRHEGASSMCRLLRQLLQIPLGHAVLTAHPPLLTAAASRLARADGNHLEPLLQDLDGSSGTGTSEARDYILSTPELLKGVVTGAVGARRMSTCAVYTSRLAARPWFSRVVESDGEVLDALLRSLGPVAQSQQQQQHQHHLGWMMSHTGASCQEAVLAQLDKEALFPKLLARLSCTEDMRLVQGAWNGLDWLRRSGAPWNNSVPHALGSLVQAAGRAAELPQLQLAVTQTAVELAQEHVALREQQRRLEAAQAELEAAGGGGMAAAAADAQPPQQQAAGGEEVQEAGGRKRRQQRGGAGGAAAGAATAEAGPTGKGQPKSRKKARKQAHG